MLPTEEILSQRLLLTAYRQMLTVYLKQQALQSEAVALPAIEPGIPECREQIRIIKLHLRQSGVTIADHPVDEASATALAGGKRRSRLLFIIRTLLNLAGFALIGYIIVGFVMLIFTAGVTNTDGPPNFSSMPLGILPFGSGLFFVGATVITLANFIGGSNRAFRQQ